MNLKSFKHINNFYLVILAISVFGFLLRLLGLNWDQGNLFHPDERQLLMISQNLSINDLDPGWYNYGTLPLYILEIFSFSFCGSPFTPMILLSDRVISDSIGKFCS